MRIAQLAPLWMTVPPATYGGTELVVHLLTEELVRRGHDVTLFAAGDSRTSAELRSVCDKSLTQAMADGEAYEYAYYEAALLAEALQCADSFDVVHSHLDPATLPFHALCRTPVLHTFSRALSRDDAWMLERYPNAHIAAVSAHQVSGMTAQQRRNVRVVHNGCDVDSYDYVACRGEYLAFLGRMSPEKGVSHAIRAAREAGMPLVIAGAAMNARERGYFADEVLPEVDGCGVRYIGAVDHAAKNAFLGGAAALLFPIQWDEPFGLVMIEAMACGTPVVACNRGAVAEVIDEGITGFHCNSLDDFAALVPAAVSLDRASVRARATARFSHHRMVDEYVGVYECISAKQ